MQKELPAEEVVAKYYWKFQVFFSLLFFCVGLLVCLVLFVFVCFGFFVWFGVFLGLVGLLLLIFL